MKKIFKLILLSCCAVIVLSSCSSQTGSTGDQEVQPPIVPLTCVAVLPAMTSVTQEGVNIAYPDALSLEKGADAATSIIKRELQGNPKVHIVSSYQLASLVPEVSGGISGTIAALGQKLNCEGVLLTTVRRYDEREGTEYSAEAPASVDFYMVLRHSSSGNILWSGDFREEQQSFLSNIFSFSKAQNRGFKWVTAEQLLDQGITERLSECPYLE